MNTPTDDDLPAALKTRLAQTLRMEGVTEF